MNVNLQFSQLFSVIFMSFVLLAGCNSETEQQTEVNPQQVLDSAAQQLQVKIKVVSNIDVEDCPNQQDQCYLANMTLTIPESMPKNWKIYFGNLIPVQWEGSEEFDIQHVNGDLHVITPLSEKINPNQAYVIPFKGANWLVSESVLFPNYILSAQGLEPRVIESTSEEIKPGMQHASGKHVLPFEALNQTRRGKQDIVPRADASWRFDNNQMLTNKLENEQLIKTANNHRVTPQVKQAEWSGERISLASGLNLDTIRSDYGFTVARLEQIGVKSDTNGLGININVDSTLANEAYGLTISPLDISIRAANQIGVFYALISLSQLYDVESNSLPTGTIFDEPRYDFRGLHLDLARNFHSKELLLKLLDQMAYLKLNKLHLHLADDEGWRLEIPGLPELTEVGSKRCLDWQEMTCLQPQLAAGVDPNSDVNGYLSRGDYIEILRLAALRNIEVIPALDMPGHSRAAIVAMHARYKKLIKQERSDEANQYHLSELEDTSEYSSIQYYNDNTLNPCLPSTYNFVSKVLSEVQLMHQEAEVPLRRYHIGADETAGAWQDSPACKLLLEQQPDITSVEMLGAYFVERVANMVEQMDSVNKVIPGAWSDGLAHARVEKLPSKVQANIWDTLFWDGFNRSNTMVSQDWDVVLSLPDVLYFDFPYEADPVEPGYYWGSRATDSFQVFQFMPDNLPVHAELWSDVMGSPYESKEQVTLEKGKKIVGIQAQLWSETVRSDHQVAYMLFPRMYAFAERAWHQADWEEPYQAGRSYSVDTQHFDANQQAQQQLDWQRFAQHVSQKMLPQLIEDGLIPRVPMPGAEIVSGKLNLNSAFPSLLLEYKVAEGDWQRYTQPTEIGSIVTVRARIEGTQVSSREQVLER